MNLDAGSVVIDVVCPDWDALIKIKATFEFLPGVALQYIKDHQDKDKPYAQLDLLGQLNVDADKQADKFQIKRGAHRPWQFCHLCPESTCCSWMVLSRGNTPSCYNKRQL